MLKNYRNNTTYNPNKTEPNNTFDKCIFLDISLQLVGTTSVLD